MDYDACRIAQLVHHAKQEDFHAQEPLVEELALLQSVRSRVL